MRFYILLKLTSENFFRATYEFSIHQRMGKTCVQIFFLEHPNACCVLFNSFISVEVVGARLSYT